MAPHRGIGVRNPRGGCGRNPSGKMTKCWGVKVLEITFKGRMLWILEDFAKICLLLLCFLFFLCVCIFLIT